MSYSRINNDQKTINIERYEDLLPISFKEVEWAKSSRVNIQEDEEKGKIASKYEKDVDSY